MSLTRRLLKELELNEDAVERIIAAHVETVDALRQERDAALTAGEAQLAETAAAREELSACRAQYDRERHAQARRSALAEALTARGANPQALPLLMDAIALPEDVWDGDRLREDAAPLEAYRAKYPGLFAVRRALPVSRVTPPLHHGGLLTHADVKRMSAADINRNWSAVRTALRND